MSRNVTHVEIEGHGLGLSNLDKVLYPASGFTKAEALDYYARISPVLLPHLAGRPLTLKRYPEGVEHPHFYEKRCPAFHPKWIKTATVDSDKHGVIDYCTVDGVASLVWVVNLASLEMHTLLARIEDIDRPTMMVFDLDPGPPASVIDSCRVAIDLRKLLSRHGLESFPKTSGGKGLHLYVPLNTPVTHERTKAFSKAAADYLAGRDPQRVTSNMRKDLRSGKVFIDWSQNDSHKTTVCVYSLRARESPTVSTPVRWNEVQSALKKDDPSRLVFLTDDVIKRVDKLGDIFEPVLSLKQNLSPPQF